MFAAVTDIFATAQLIFGAALAVGLLFFAHRFFGWRGVAAGLIALATLGLYRKGRADGRTQVIEKEAEHAEEVVREANDARTDARRRDADPERLRVDDGFKRP